MTNKTLRRHALTIFRASLATSPPCGVAQASHRPLARDPQAFAALYQARQDHYRLADVHVPISSDDPEITVAAILAHPLFK
jgi:hypothetical protein